MMKDFDVCDLYSFS